MLPTKELKKIANGRLKDGEVLFNSRRYDGAVYLCGYAVEIALKIRICKTLNWLGYPSSRADFQRYRSFRTHDLDVLLHISGREEKIKNKFLAEWSVVGGWDPEVRYKPIGSVKRQDAKLMIEASKKLVRAL